MGAQMVRSRSIASLLLLYVLGMTHVSEAGSAQQPNAAPMQIQNAQALTSKTIDRRVRSEDRSYALVFAAQAPGPNSTFGHAFIVWEHGDDAKQMTVADAVGFQAAKQDATKIKKVLGLPGALLSDAGIPVDTKLTVLVNSDLYQLALDQKLQWGQAPYEGFWQNCVVHVADIAKAIGLDTGDGKWTKPQDYVKDLSDKNNSLPADAQVPTGGASLDDLSFPHEDGSPTLNKNSTALQKLEYALQLADWAATKHPVIGFKQQTGAWQLDPFEWQIVQALAQIDSIPDAKTLGADPVQTEYWGHNFYQNLIDKPNFKLALQQLASPSAKPAPSENNLVAGAKEAARAALAQQLSSYLDRGNPWQTLQQFADLLKSPNGAAYGGTDLNVTKVGANLNQAIQHGVMQRTESIKFESAVWSQSAYRQAVQSLQQAVDKYNQQKADYENLTGGSSLAPVSVPNTPQEQEFKGFLTPSW